MVIPEERYETFCFENAFMPTEVSKHIFTFCRWWLEPSNSWNRHWTGSRVQKCDPFEQVLWKMKSWRIKLAKVRLRTETEVASLQTSDCTRLCADLNGKFNFNFSMLKTVLLLLVTSVWYTQQWVIYINLIVTNFCLSLPKRVHENQGCVADEII